MKSASSVYPRKDCYAVETKPKLGRGSKRKSRSMLVHQQGQSSKAVEGIGASILSMKNDHLVEFHLIL